MAGMTKAISTGALTYLATLGSAVFLPVGAAVAAGKVLSLATALNFAPVPFPAGQAEVPEDGHEQLDTLASLLGERPKLRLTLCGYAAPIDRLLAQAAELHRLREQKPKPPPPPQPHPPVDPVELPEIPDQLLLDLATARGQAVMDYLVQSGSVAPGRLLVCSPELTEDASPRVDVSL
jgi:outer membrane protein OmpA-like peptidoglycan-associated protein